MNLSTYHPRSPRTEGHLHNARGFALPTVLFLLILATLVAVTAVTMATSQVRMAGDLHASVTALNAAEGGATQVVAGFIREELEWLDDGTYSGDELVDVAPDLPTSEQDSAEHGEPGARWWLESMEFEEDEVTLLVHGFVPGPDRERVVEVTFNRGSTDTTSPFAGAVVGCDGVSLSGSGRVDSWDSAEGPYAPHRVRDNAGVGTLSNLGDVVLSGSSPVLGDLLAGRDIRLSGSAAVSGDWSAVRNIALTGNPSCPAGEVKAGGAVSPPGQWWVDGCGNPTLESGADVPAPSDPCDPLGVASLVADSMNHYRPPAGSFQNWPHNGWRPNPVHIDMDQGYSGNVNIGPGAHPLTIDAGAVAALFVDGNFSLTGSAIVRLVNPSTIDDPQVIRIFVDGSFNASGGSQLEFDPNIVLVVYSTGRIQFQGGHSQSIPATVELDDGLQPTFSIYTSFSGSNGVRVGGSSPLSATVYAPLTDVSVSGSGDLYGAVRGRTVSVSGSGGIHYDEALGLVASGGGTSSTDPRIVAWREVR